MNVSLKRFVSVGYASDITGFDKQTIRKMVDKKEITGFKTLTGQRRIDKQSLQRLCGINIHDEEQQNCKKQNFIYTRVSTRKQMDDLSRQVNFLQQYKPEYSGYTTIEDIGSGINFKRKGLSKILECCIQQTIGEVVVAHRDRLSRFGFDLIEQFVEKGGGRITVLEGGASNKSTQQELSEDLLSIIHVFNCRQMGRRSYSTKIKNVETQN